MPKRHLYLETLVPTSAMETFVPIFYAAKDKLNACMEKKANMRGSDLFIIVFLINISLLLYIMLYIYCT